MDVKEYFTVVLDKYPEKKSIINGILLSIQRDGLKTMEELCEKVRSKPEEVARIRNIGPCSMKLIEDICNLYEKENKK